MKNALILILIIFLISACNRESDYYPEKHIEMKAVFYKKFKAKLDTAYLNDDYFEVGIQLSNLKAPSKEVYKYINKGIDKDKDNCYQIYHWFSIYNDFKTNLVKSDTFEFLKTHKICLGLLGDESYSNFMLQKQLDHKNTILKREKLDSTLFDLELMQQLEQIRIDDQELRVSTNFDVLTNKESKDLSVEMDKIDSINLTKIEAIIEENGYPRKEQVGYELTIVPWLVLHHQSDISIRDKYQKIIEENCGAGLLNAYNWRSSEIRLENE